VLGTASQIKTGFCLSVKAVSLKGGVLSAKDASSLVLAAFSLLNVKMALISCFSTLMLLLVVVSLMIYKCDTKKFVSRKGTTNFNIWALIYETIETSTMNSLIKFVCDCVSDKTPTMSESDKTLSPVSSSASLSFTTNSDKTPTMSESDNTLSPVSSSASLCFTSNRDYQYSPAFQPNGTARKTVQCRMSHAVSMETMETTFVNHYNFGFQVRFFNVF
jgi:hypothetical protein